MAAIWLTGPENCIVYWMNAWISPIEIAPAATRSPPMTATST